MFEKASRIKLRFNAHCGVITTEDLWDLTLIQLNALAKNLNKEVKSSQEEDFLKDILPEDTIPKLKFDLVLYVLNTKKQERTARLEAKEKKARKEKILEIIAKKQDNALEEKTEDELLKELAGLG
jgi:hypothetical protein